MSPESVFPTETVATLWLFKSYVSHDQSAWWVVSSETLRAKLIFHPQQMRFPKHQNLSLHFVFLNYKYRPALQTRSHVTLSEVSDTKSACSSVQLSWVVCCLVRWSIINETLWQQAHTDMNRKHFSELISCCCCCHHSSAGFKGSVQTSEEKQASDPEMTKWGDPLLKQHNAEASL